MEIKEINLEKFKKISLSRREEQSAFKSFIKFVEGSNENIIKISNIRNFINSLIQRELCKNTVCKYKQAVKNAAYLYWEDVDFSQCLIWNEIISKISTGKDKRNKRNSFVEKDQFVFIFNKLIENKRRRTAALLLFHYITGVRTCESPEVRLVDCTKKDEWIYIKIHSTKNGKDRHVLIDETSFYFIKDSFSSREYLLENKYGNKFNPPAIRDHFQRASKISGIDVYPYIFRKSLGTSIFMGTKDSFLGSKVLGNTPEVFNKHYCNPVIPPGLEPIKTVITNNLSKLNYNIKS